MAVYFLRAGDTEMVKIGWTTGTVEQRMATIQPGCWQTLRVIREVSGGRAVETWLHKRFAHCHVEREWFCFDPEMLTVEPREIDRSGKVREVFDWLKRAQTQPCLGYLAKELCLPEGVIASWQEVPEEYLDEVSCATRTGPWFYRPDLAPPPWRKPKRGGA